jgi:tetratricopeptide (TPR) repeat protein
MTGDFWPSAFTAAVFAVHPLRVESVAWVAERKDLLCGLFFMLALWAYLGYVRRPFSLARYLLVALLFALGLMAKPMLVTLPLLLLLLDFWPLRRVRGIGADGELPQHSRRWLVVEKIPLLAMTAVSCVVTSLAQHKALATFETMTPLLRVANAAISYVAYLGEFFYPSGLAIFYPYPVSGVSWVKAACAVLLLAVVTAGVLMKWRRRPWLPVGWFWYLGMLVPVIGVVQVGSQAMADRYTYLPQIGITIALAWTVADLVRQRAMLRRACALASFAVVATLMACAWQQTTHWSDSETLWVWTSRCTEGNVFTHNNMGNLLVKCNRLDEAIRHYQKALEIDPRSAITHNNLGNVMVACRQIEKAVAEYQLALNLQPDNAKTHNNLGILLTSLGRTDEALAEYQKALDFSTDYAEPHNNLGVALMGIGRIDEAISHFKEAIRINPDCMDAYENLGSALAQQGKIADALDQWRVVLKNKANSLSTINKYAWTLATCPESSIRNGAEAVELAEWGVKLSMGHNPALLGTLAAAYAETGRYADADKFAECAISVAATRGDLALADAFRKQRQTYRAGSPYRDQSIKRP